jgi:hypothetical protein
MDSQIIPREEIKRLAYASADAQIPVEQANPYSNETRAHLAFEILYWERVRDLGGETSA